MKDRLLKIALVFCLAMMFVGLFGQIFYDIRDRQHSHRQINENRAYLCELAQRNGDSQILVKFHCSVYFLQYK